MVEITRLFKCNIVFKSSHHSFVLVQVTNSAVHFIDFGAQDLLESDEQLKAGKASSR